MYNVRYSVYYFFLAWSDIMLDQAKGWSDMVGHDKVFIKFEGLIRHSAVFCTCTTCM
jgi:hypothetical protein